MSEIAVLLEVAGVSHPVVSSRVALERNRLEGEQSHSTQEAGGA